MYKKRKFEKKKLLGEVAGGVGEMAFLISFSKMFPEF